MGSGKKKRAGGKKSALTVDMALTIGAKKLHTARQFMYEEGKKYNSQFIDAKTGLCKPQFLETRPCPVCASSKSRELFIKGGGRYVACGKCTMVYLNPAFTDKALVNFYSGNLATQAQVVANETDFSRRIYSKGLAAITKFRRTGEILDVGCSSGFFLDLAKEAGWKTVGVELNKAEAEMARKKHEVHVTSIFSLEVKKRFDAIVMWDVLEHIKNGNKTLQLFSKKLLRKRGLLFLQIPNSGSLATRVMQEKSKMFDGIEHVNLYNPSTISLLAKNNGFDVLHLETVISEIPVIANYLNYQDPYLGEAVHGGKILDIIDEKTLHKKKLGYKMQVVLRSR
ncbi:MAG: class I SAM-dependent methyltransferase [bacterium]|nr:class I SAM-dependent methyltransferase [bacterium]